MFLTFQNVRRADPCIAMNSNYALFSLYKYATFSSILMDQASGLE